MAISGRGARAKGFRAEAEVCDILTELGVPSQRVLASGALQGAEGDIKVGVDLLPNGEFPQKDEGVALFRAESKNRATNKDTPYEWLATEPIFALAGAPKEALELPFKDLEQSIATKILFWKRAKTPKGTLSQKNYNQAYLAIMGIADFASMVKEVLELRKEVHGLRLALNAVITKGS